MSQLVHVPPNDASFGALLQHWRKARHLSQLALATEAGISSKHLSFVETGRAKPSRDMVLLLGRALDVPLRERNSLLLAAGFAPVYRETSLEAPELAAVKGALDAILRQQEPYPAVVMNRQWDIVTTNAAASRFFEFVLRGQPPVARPNVLCLMLKPDGARPFVLNWNEVAEALIRRVHREATGGISDPRAQAVLAEVLDYPDVRECLRSSNRDTPMLPIVPVSFAKDGHRFNYFSTVTTLGTPQDVTAQELRIECFFPADDETRQAARELLTDRDSTAPASAS